MFVEMAKYLVLIQKAKLSNGVLMKLKGLKIVVNKIVIAKTHEGYHIPPKITDKLESLYGLSFLEVYALPRHDKRLVDAVEDYYKSNPKYQRYLKVVEIGANEYYIDEYDGVESIITPENIKWIKI
jgi:predicted GTPase